jgi:hypothetical protein
MKHVKMFGLAAMASMALMGLVAASASATALYSGATKLGTGTEVRLTLSGTSSLASTEGTTLSTCTGMEFKGKTTTAGSSTETVKLSVPASGLTFSGCTFTTDTLAGGELEFHWTSGVNGSVTAKGFEWTTNTGLFGSCVFTFGLGTNLGAATGSSVSNATIDVNSVISRKSGLCPASERWLATFKITSPTPLHVTAS